MKQVEKIPVGLCILVLGVVLVSIMRVANVSPFSTSRFSRTVTPPVVSSPLIKLTPADRAIRMAETEIRRLLTQSEGYVALADAYMRKSRESGDPDYYLRAEAAVQKALTLQPDSPLGLRTLGWVQTGKHEFREALVTTERLLTRSPNDPLVYGLLGDATIELGEYERAAAAFEKMVDLRPGLASYSRLAYIRELFGDLQGAQELMQLAVKAGNRQDPEPFAWTLIQLGNLHFHQGQLQEAERAYQAALTMFPQYHQALAAFGRVRAAQQRYAEAIALYRQATMLVPAPDTIAELGDVLAFIGQHQEAEQQYTLIEYIEGVNAAKSETYTRQLALFYANHERKLDQAITLAEAESARRKDIYTFDTLAWVYYKAGRLDEAWQAMRQALRLGTKDASLFFHAGMIAYEQRKWEKAMHYLKLALKTNPYFSLTGIVIARQTVATLINEDKREKKLNS